MKVVLIHNCRFPVAAYGGTERVVWWLARGLHRKGIDVILASAPGSECDFAKVVHPDFSKSIEAQIPDADLYHHFVTPNVLPTKPYVVTIGGNGRAGEEFLPNTIFVSRNHARRHGCESFVYNGVDPDEYVFETKKDGSLLFLAKASWNVKNVRGAIRYARRTGRSLNIVGGKRWLFKDWNGVHWRGMLGGAPKADFISRASGLLFPVLWDEPFGLAVVEAMVSGTPVLASPFGSLPELVGPGAGVICRSESDFIDAIGALEGFDPRTCRDWALSKFDYRIMTDEYIARYERVVRGEPLSSSNPLARESARLYSIPSRTA